MRHNNKGRKNKRKNKNKNKKMEDQELIQKIKELKQIRPRQNWVFSAKERVFQSEPQYKSNILFSFRNSFQIKLAVSALLVLIVGVLALAQGSLPGEPLYPVKRVTEGIKLAFTGQNRSMAYLDSADNRVKELNQIAQSNQTSKLPVALQESANALNKAATNISPKTIDGQDSSQQVAQVIKKVIDINQNLSQVENKLHIDIPAKKVLADKASNLIQEGTESSTSSYYLAQIVKEEIQSREQTSLTEEGQKCLNLAKKYYNEYKEGEVEDRYKNLSKAIQTLLTCQ